MLKSLCRYWLVILILATVSSCGGGGDSSDDEAASSAAMDRDGDGISDDIEMAAGYDPADRDSDDDGLSDGIEDANRDGLLDVNETSPVEPDTDADGWCDGPRMDNDSNGLTPASSCTGQEIVFVDAAATGTSTGASWDDAFISIQAATMSVAANQQIWVAAGTYKPNVANETILTMVDNVDVYGGFIGTEGSVAQRPAPLPQTLLNGDFNNDDPIITDNANPVVLGASNTRIDGLVVTNGGLGMDNFTVANIVLTNNRFEDNQSGGLRNSNVTGPVLVQNSIFRNNFNDLSGGGIGNFSTGSHVTVLDSLFEGNETRARGGGLSDNMASASLLDGLIFDSNIAMNPVTAGHAQGGGLGSNRGSTTIVRNSVFIRNEAHSGGGVYTGNGSRITASNLVIIDNHSPSSRGGGIYLDNSDATFTNILVAENTALVDGGGFWGGNSGATLTNFTFANNTAGNYGGAIYEVGRNTGVVLTVTNTVFYGNSATNLSDYFPDLSPLPVLNNNCSEQDLTIWGATPHALLTVSPFNIGPEGAYYLDPASTCVNMGNDATATAEFGAAGLDWQAMTTFGSGQLDLSPVDAGYHYSP